MVYRNGSPLVGLNRWVNCVRTVICSVSLFVTRMVLLRWVVSWVFDVFDNEFFFVVFGALLIDMGGTSMLKWMCVLELMVLDRLIGMSMRWLVGRFDTVLVLKCLGCMLRMMWWFRNSAVRG